MTTPPLFYRYPVDALLTGSSLGNRRAFARLDAETNLRGLWSSLDNQYYAGAWSIRVTADGHLLTPRETTFTPESQTTLLSHESFTVEKQFFLPFFPDVADIQSPSELQTAIFLLRLTNRGPHPVLAQAQHVVTFPAVPTPLFTKQPPDDQTVKRMDTRILHGRCEVATRGKPSEARVFGSAHRWTSCVVNDTTLEAEYASAVPPGESAVLPCVLAFSPDGMEQATAIFFRCQDTAALLQRTLEAYRTILSRTEIVTPDPLLNRALQWSKVNTVRVQHTYRIGEGFTNDPPQDIVVIRDLAWYVLGSDFLTPEFSRGLLHLAESFAYHDGGKLTEYLHANEELPVQHDYRLNVNDDTPLFVLALYHHAVTCDDEYSLKRVYPLMKRACDWILGQMEDGLVQCRARGTSVWGICSWRNIIDGYTLSGAVTEINAECVCALRLTAEIAGCLGERSHAERYAEASRRLRDTINGRLVSERTGAYLLNLDNDGMRHHDITGDLIFPVLFDVADQEMREHILATLTNDALWTPYGSRSVSSNEWNYDPDFGYQLVGGVWPNLTAWVAYCLREADPGRLVEGMTNIYRISESPRPVDFDNVVPGQFPERLHGATFRSRGMTMSPWTPPTYLWLGVEGLVGLKATTAGLELNPAIPPDWTWIAVKNLLFRGVSITAFMLQGTLYSTHQVTSRYPLKLGVPVETVSDNPALVTIGLADGREVFLFVAGDAGSEGDVTVIAHDVRMERHVRIGKEGAVLLRFSPSTTGSAQAVSI